MQLGERKDGAAVIVAPHAYERS